jgi:hypothetical protein
MTWQSNGAGAFHARFWYAMDAFKNGGADLKRWPVRDLIERLQEEFGALRSQAAAINAPINLVPPLSLSAAVRGAHNFTEITPFV